jgi:O-acetyl-ADP-ribose deacetylase (regulator of RNase III)
VAPVGDARLEVVAGDLALWAADVLVNAASEGLRGGGGVDSAIHRAAGPGLMRELRASYASCPTGSAVITDAYLLPARWVVHAVGPVWEDGHHGEAELLASAYRSALVLAEGAGARSVALPAISCGAYGYPLPEGARIALQTAAEHLATESKIDEVTFVLRSEDVQAAFTEALGELPGAFLETWDAG